MRFTTKPVSRSASFRTDRKFGDAPKAELRAPGVVRVNREGRVLTVLTRDREALMTEVRGLAPASIDWSSMSASSNEAVAPPRGGGPHPTTDPGRREGLRERRS